MTAVLAAALLSVGGAACGGDGDSAGDEGAAARQQAQQGNGERQSAAEDGAGGEKKEKESGSGSGGGANGGQGSSGDFTPKSHDDSGGGAAKLRVKGGDNSVQEFGSEAGGEEFDQAAQALHNFLDARAERKWDAACSYMAASVRESLESFAAQSKELKGAGCGRLLQTLTNPAALGALRKEAARADVGSLRTEGDRGFVIYRGLEGTILAVPMAREDGEWKVASLAGTPLN